MRRNQLRVLLAPFAWAIVAIACGDSKTSEPTPAGPVGVWLAAHPQIAAELVWDAGDGKGPKSYNAWSGSDRAALEQAVTDATNGVDPHLADPPVNLAAHAIGDDDPAITILSSTDARGLYFAHVGRSLMLEMTHGVPWSIVDYAPADLAILLDSRSFFLWKSNTRSLGIAGYVVYDDTATSTAVADAGAALTWTLPAPPAVSVAFLTQNGIIANDRLTTIVRLIDWERYNLLHFSNGFTASNNFGHWQYRGVPPASRVMSGTTVNFPPLPPYPAHWTAGCPGTNYFMMDLLRTVNIPVRYLVVEQHATPYFPSEHVYLSHGDDPYTISWSPAVPTTPASALLVDEATYARWFSPTLTAAQRQNNIERRPTELELSTLSNLVLSNRCRDIKAGTTSHAGSLVAQGFKRYYSVADLEALDLWNRVDAKIATLGGCSAITLAQR